ncbi:unnamed protein product [marine sediment metagenome]|uniref:Methyltransferase type 11 domain-containing protein n=1 Tax=marine sediment metagenome TaxID=412755 RepID=X1GFG5_9ZZZZ
MIERIINKNDLIAVMMLELTDRRQDLKELNKKGLIKIKRVARKLIAFVKRNSGDIFLPSNIKKQLKDFKSSPENCRASFIDKQINPVELAKRYEKVGIKVDRVEINIKDFENWMGRYSSLIDYYKAMGDVFIEKVLEHYLTHKYCMVKRSDVFIDVAASGSPWADILSTQGNKAYKLDLSYPSGINGIKIGTDAGNTGLPDNFADVLALHCAYECFYGDADIRFISEAERISRNGGRIGIIPLYTNNIYYNKTSPYCDQRKVQIDPEAKKIWRDDSYKVPFRRHYSPEKFKTRIYAQIGSMKCKILYFTDLDELMEKYKKQQIYCHFMLYCEKA